MEWTYKDGKLDGSYTEWHENGQKAAEYTCKDGELYGGPWTRWRENGQKKSELFFNDGGFVSATKWDEEGNARLYDDYWNEIKQ